MYLHFAQKHANKLTMKFSLSSISLVQFDQLNNDCYKLILPVSLFDLDTYHNNFTQKYNYVTALIILIDNVTYLYVLNN